jgi:hypothetical protein
MEFELGECEECANGIHGMQHPKFPNTCLCCRNVVGAENLKPNPYGVLI